MKAAAHTAAFSFKPDDLAREALECAREAPLLFREWR
jgi:hypothetical protein